jgi:hypothetical protein
MTVELVDYANTHPDPKSLRAAGKVAVCRYVVTSSSIPGKPLSLTEAKALTSAGVAIVSNWERNSGDMLLGYDKGRAAAIEAYQVHRACGGPWPRPIYFSCDVDTTSAAQREAAWQFCRGAGDQIGIDNVGVYGEYEVVDYMYARGLRWLWQTYAWSSRQGIFAHNTIYQYKNGVTVAGVNVDLDRSNVADFGQWTVGGVGGSAMADYGNLGLPTSVPDWISQHPDIMTADLHAAVTKGISGWGDGSAVWLVGKLDGMEAKLDALAKAQGGGTVTKDMVKQALQELITDGKITVTFDLNAGGS